MNVKQELHRLVDQLGDARAAEAVAYLRELVADDEHTGSILVDHPAQRFGPSTISGQDFFAAPRVDLDTLSARQGTQPVTRLEDLLGDFWPEDETADEFIATVRAWRREGGCG